MKEDNTYFLKKTVGPQLLGYWHWFQLLIELCEPISSSIQREKAEGSRYWLVLWFWAKTLNEFTKSKLSSALSLTSLDLKNSSKSNSWRL